MSSAEDEIQLAENPMSKTKNISSTQPGSLKSKYSHQFSGVADEINSVSTFKLLPARDRDAVNSFRDLVSYKVENLVSSERYTRFVLLLGSALTIGIILAGAWVSIPHELSDNEILTSSLQDSFFFTFILLSTGEYDTSIQKGGERVVYGITIIIGILVVAVLIGIVTDTVSSAMQEIASGKTKIIEEGHTLVLGWNNSTVRLICQTAFLRRIWRQQNETLARRLLPWLRVQPTSPVAKNKIVLLSTWQDKAAVEETLAKAFAEFHISSRRTKLGRDVIVRVGDPTSTHDLIRVSAHKATSIAIMLTSMDASEAAHSAGRISNSATLRCLLALRSILFSQDLDAGNSFDPDLRIVVQLQERCDFIEAATFVGPNGQQTVFPMDVGAMINTVMFKCSCKPGLAQVLTDLLDFEHFAVRSRRADQVYGGQHDTCGYFIGLTVRQATLSHCWAQGVFLGVSAQLSSSADATGVNEGQEGKPRGIMGDPNRVIKADDFVIFISSTSNPRTSTYAADKINFANKSKDVSLGDNSTATSNSGPAIARRLSSVNLGSDSDTPQHVLVMGWRPEWSSNPLSFRSRLRQICDDLPRDSTLTFLNVTKPSDFHLLVTQGSASVIARANTTTEVVGSKFDKDAAVAWAINPTAAARGDFSNGWNVQEGDGGRVFFVSHVWGDPVMFRSVSAALRGCEHPFETVICLGSVVGNTELPSEARDSRVLSMGLMLRQITDNDPRYQGRPIHVVAENQLEQTPHLAVIPKRSLAPPSSLTSLVNVAKENTASIEPWAAPLQVFEEPAFISPRKENPSNVVLQPGAQFRFVETRQVVSPDDAAGLAPTIFYRLADKSGWVHDRSTARPGRRTIKVKLANAGIANAATSPEPDFVNNKALVARAIAMSLAYPQIEACVLELCSPMSGTPEIEFYPPACLGLPCDGKISVPFGVIQERLDALYQGYAVAIGVVLSFDSDGKPDGKLELAPRLGKEITWSSGDRVVCIVRHARKPALQDAAVETLSPRSEGKFGGETQAKHRIASWREAAKMMAYLPGAPTSLESVKAGQDLIMLELANMKRNMVTLNNGRNFEDNKQTVEDSTPSSESATPELGSALEMTPSEELLPNDKMEENAIENVEESVRKV